MEPEGLPVVDLGCGRGEWLEILKAAAIPLFWVYMFTLNLEKPGSSKEKSSSLYFS